MKKIIPTTIFLVLMAAFLFTNAFAQRKLPPYDLWDDAVLEKILDRTTLDYQTDPQYGYAEVWFTANGSASFFDAKEPYAEHQGEKIRIHGYLAYPAISGNFPAIVVAHGRGSQADLSFAQVLSSLGLVVLAIDGPQAGKSTGGPADSMQSWISLDKGAQYGYLYHYSYAAMRGLTLIETMADLNGNPYKIDSTKLGALGLDSGGMVVSCLNGFDARMKAALIVAAAGNIHPTLRVANSWFYRDLYLATRDTPYNSKDPLNSVEDIDGDSTLIRFLNYFDPGRYALRQYAPVMTLLGTHDQYFPLPSANLMQWTTTVSATLPSFKKRLWLLPNTDHPTLNYVNTLSLSSGIRQWFDYCFGKRAEPLSVPQIVLTDTGDGLRFEINTGETTARLAGSSLQLFAATKVDSTSYPLKDFTTYSSIRDGVRFLVSLPAGERSAAGEVYTAQNIIYYATLSDTLGLPVSSQIYRGSLPLSLSSSFSPVINRYSTSDPAIPAPPAQSDAMKTAASALTLANDNFYQGISLANPTSAHIAVRLEARGTDGRFSTAETLFQPILLSIPARTQQIFLFDEWLGRGVRSLTGAFLMGWNDARGASLAFRGNVATGQLDAIGPVTAPGKTLWVPLVPEQDRSTSRRLRLFSAASSSATVTLTYRNRSGTLLEKGQILVPAWGSAELEIAVGSGDTEYALVQIESTQPVSARAEVRPSRDTWSIEALPTPAATHFVQPHAEWNGVYKTRFLIANTGSGLRNIRFRRYSTAGAALGRDITVTIDKGQTGSLVLETLFGVLSSETPGAGWVDVDVPGGEVILQAVANDARMYATAASAVGSGLSGTLSMPFFVANAGYWTGLAIANVGGTPSQVTVTAYSETGEKIGQGSTNMAVNQSSTQLVHQWMPDLPREATGQILISSNGSLAVLAYFGTIDGAALAAIPLSPVPD